MNFDRLWAKWQDESGQNLVLVALFMVVILGIAALVLDGGYAFAQRRRMQNAADAGAMAGARALALGEDAAPIAQQYAIINGAQEVPPPDIDITETSVRVRARTTFPTFFASVMGLSQMTAEAEAEASFSGISKLQGAPLWPMAVYTESIDLDGGTTTIWDDAHEGPGNFGWVDFNGGSNPAGEQAEWLAYGFMPGENDRALVYQTGDWSSPYVWVPSLDLYQFGSHGHFWIEGAPGVRSSLESVAAARIGDTVTLLVYDDTNQQGSNFRFRIVGFAQFLVTSVDFHGNPKEVQGQFSGFVSFGKGGAPVDFGLRTVNLTY